MLFKKHNNERAFFKEYHKKISISNPFLTHNMTSNTYSPSNAFELDDKVIVDTVINAMSSISKWLTQQAESDEKDKFYIFGETPTQVFNITSSINMSI